ncbi:MAG: hypothetical protein E7573_11055 [Ruminococcaceae bacterium]|nr:hypothetical protein [Oscillospiraceae bacterium]MBR3596654.1 metallophosphoesterase [Clostridia bacterium]
MIYITGDIHGDTERLSKTELSMLNANDTLIVCGDFGFIWNDDKKEKQYLNLLEKRKYNICFIDGTHENFDVLNNFPVVLWHSGRVHKIRDNVFHLMRGQIYEIDGKKIFTMGGGEDPELDLQENDDMTLRKEIPTAQEMLTGVTNIEKHGYKVDYIITHEPPAKIRDFLLLSENKTLRVTALGAYLDELSQQCEYKKWFFGSMHIDKFISETHTSLFKNIVSTEPNPNKKRFRK